MSKWEMVRLGDVCEILDSQRIPIKESERKSGIYPYYGANGIQDYVDSYIFDDELVLVAEDGGHFGSKTKPIAYRVSGKCWVNNHAHVLKPKAMIDVDYLCYSLMFYDVSKYINGATRQKLNQNALKLLEIPLPPLAEQKKIAQELDSIQSLITKRKDQLEKMDLLVKAKFVEMFGDPVTNPMGWATNILSNICITIVDCPHSTPHFTQENTGYACIRTSILKKNKIQWNKVEYISEEEFNERVKRKIPQRGDIIYSREGAILGIAAVLNVDFPVALGQRMMLLSPNTELINSHFLSMGMNFESFLQKALKNLGGSASPHINVADIKKFEMILPPIKLQNQFADYVQQTETLKTSMHSGLEKLELLYSSKMQEYFG